MAVSHFLNEFCCCRCRFLLTDTLLTDTRGQFDVDLLIVMPLQGESVHIQRAVNINIRYFGTSCQTSCQLGLKNQSPQNFIILSKKITVRVYCSFQLRALAGCKILDRLRHHFHHHKNLLTAQFVQQQLQHIFSYDNNNNYISEFIVQLIKYSKIWFTIKVMSASCLDNSLH